MGKLDRRGWRVSGTLSPLVALSLLLAGPISAEELEDDWRTVERAVDGDTLVLEGGERVRLIGVDAQTPGKGVLMLRARSLGLVCMVWIGCSTTSPTVPVETHELDHLPPCEARTVSGVDRETLAVLTASRYAVADFPRIALLDRKPYVMPYDGFEGLSCNHRITRIEPGPHSIHVAWASGGHGRSLATELEFDARPGHAYELVIEKTRAMAAAHLLHTCRILDRTTGEVVVAREASCGVPETYDVFDEIWAAYGACGDETGVARMEADGFEPDPEACREPWFRMTREPSGTIGTLFMRCGSPYELTEDCSDWVGAKREVEIQGARLKIAGSADGRIVWLRCRDARILRPALGEVSGILVEAGVGIEEIRPVGLPEHPSGYVLLTGGDAYSVLKAYSVGLEASGRVPARPAAGLPEGD